MLNDNVNFLSPLQQTLAGLQNSKFGFWLTGSRFFGNAHELSDWDFITGYNQEVEAHLKELGFVLNEGVQDYLDKMTTKVLTKHFCSCEFHARDWHEEVRHTDECLKIDIQLAHDLDLKLTVRNILKENFSHVSLPSDKCQRSKLWDMVYNLVKPKE